MFARLSRTESPLPDRLPQQARPRRRRSSATGSLLGSRAGCAVNGGSSEEKRQQQVIALGRLGWPAAAAHPAQETVIQLELATAYAKVGLIQWGRYYNHLGERVGALASQQKALDIRKAIAAAHPGDDLAQADLGSSHLLIGDLQAAGGELQSFLSGLVLLPHHHVEFLAPALIQLTRKIGCSDSRRG